MPRQRSDKRDRAFEIWKQSGGKVKLKDIATELEVQDTQIRKWKNQDKWDEKIKGNVTNSKRNVTNKGGAPKNNKNALGHGAPIGSKNAERHGFFSRIFPDDPETKAIVDSIEIKSPLDIIWENIVIQYTAIARAQKIMFVKDQGDITKELKREKEGNTLNGDSWEKEWDIQYAWDKQANFLQAQSRAIATLEKLVSRYDEMLPGAMKHEEQKLRIEKLKADIAKIKVDPDEENPDDGFMEALAGKGEEVWGDEVSLDSEVEDDES